MKKLKNSTPETSNRRRLYANIGSLVVNSLDYIFIVDKDCRIIYNTRYDEKLNDGEDKRYPSGYF